MKLLNIITIVGTFFYKSFICFINYSRTKENIYKQATIGYFLLSIATLLIALKALVPIPSYVNWLVSGVLLFTGISIIDKTRRLHPNFKAPVEGRERLRLNVIIILSFIFVSLIIFLGISMQSQHDLLINKGRVVSAVIEDNAKLGSYSIIYYHFNDNGVWVRKNESVKGIIQGRNIEDFKRGDRIEVQFYNGQSMIKGYYEQNLQPMIFFFIGLVGIFLWAVRKRWNLASNS